MDKIILSKGMTIHLDGLPFILSQDTFVEGVKVNLSLLSPSYKLFGVSSVLKVAQSETSSTQIPSSESIKDLK